MKTLAWIAGFVCLCTVMTTGCGEGYPRTIDQRAKQELNSKTKEWPSSAGPNKKGGVTLIAERVLYNGEGSYTVFITGSEYHSLEPIDIYKSAFSIKVLADTEEGDPMHVDYYKGARSVEIHLHSGREIGGGAWTEEVGSGKHKKEKLRHTSVVE